ncbi:MAG TPA: PLDc N-terminal domain-containing protein [Solirubrobacteraceae bacterium]|nr:PLDc N-terminal domain-containing protein [Solirubrobacteraceae bacterium]
MLLTLLAIVWALIWVLTLVDILRRRDLRTSAKVLWALAVLLLPVVGLLVYVVARPPDGGVPSGGPDAGPPDERLRGRHPV